MAKKKKKNPRPGKAAPMSQRLAEGLNQAHQLSGRGQLAKARDILEQLKARYPGRQEVLHMLAETTYDLKDYRAHQAACEELVELRPDHPGFALMLAGAYLRGLQPALALRAFQRFLERWPDHPRAKDAQKSLAMLESSKDEFLKELHLRGDDALEVAILHEEVQSFLGRGMYPEARRKAEELLRRRPQYTAALNNIGEAFAREWRLNEAIASVHRTLEIAPENVHALSNLIRYLVLNGRLEEAQSYVPRLKAVPAVGHEPWTKKAEALTYLGDDEGVLEVLRQFQEAAPGPEYATTGFLYHMAAVAALRLGREDEARRYWDEALRRQPGLDLARENVRDLRKPVGQRHAPWPFSMNYWLPKNLIDGLIRHLTPVQRSKDETAVARRTAEFLQMHPPLAALLPVLLDRGDPAAREFAKRLAVMAKTPALLAALRDFALSQRGPDALRHEAAQVVSQAGLLPSGPVRMWFEGAWREILVLGWEISGEPANYYKHSPQVKSLYAEAMEATYRGDNAGAERLFKKALEREPDAPDLLNNLAASYQSQGRMDEAEALLRQIHERFPDYLFGRTSMAKLHIQNGRLDEARALLDPLMQRKRFHTAEFTALASAEIDYWVAKGRPSAARQWYHMWKQIDPDHPMLAAYRSKVLPAMDW